MAILSTRNSRNVTRSFASLTTRCAFFLLLAAIAATSFRSISLTSNIFALAEGCADKRTLKVKRNRRKIYICDWVAKKPESRCFKKVKRSTVKSTRNGRKRVTTLKVKPWKHCSCICPEDPEDMDNENKPEDPENIDSEETNGNDKMCPETYDSTSNTPRDIATIWSSDDSVSAARSFLKIAPGSCLDDGYTALQTCHYDYEWTGCTLDKLQCEAPVSCTCANEFIGTGVEWECALFTFPFCADDLRDDGFYLVPAAQGNSCKLGDPIPKELRYPAPIVADEGLQGIRRN